MKEEDSLEDFAPRGITLDGVTKQVYVVMSEMPGISPHVARFGGPGVRRIPTLHPSSPST
jgi:hypothetical protein